MAKQRRAEERLSFIVVARAGSGPTRTPSRSRISFSVGPHAGNVGGQLSLRHVLDGAAPNPRFATEFDAAELHWLMPFLARLEDGEDVTEEVIAAYVVRHGTRPGGGSRPATAGEGSRVSSSTPALSVRGCGTDQG